MHDPREAHYGVLKRIIRYLQGTTKYGLHLSVSSASTLTAYTDADWSGCPDSRRSTSGYCVYLGENLVSWSSKRQATVSRSSAEAEYRGVANVVAEACWLRNLLLELHCPIQKATVVYCDNVSAIYLSGNPVNHQRTKHIEIDIHFVREKVALGQVQVCRDPRWGRCYESYSEDPEIVREMTDIIYGLQGKNPEGPQNGVPYVEEKDKVAACAKHFVGDGGTTNGINENNTVIDTPGLFKIHMPAYLDAISKGVSTIMVSYSSLNGVKMHANRNLITGFLKNTLQFQGFVISDSKGIDRLTYPDHANYTYSVLMGIRAGLDMVMVPENYTEFIDILTSLVKNKYISMDRIDDAVTRILRVKFTMGLFENPMADFSLVNELGSQEHRNLAREAVRKTLVLLKNGKEGDTPLLPLPKRVSKILVAGTHAHNLGYQCGGWTINWQGFRNNDDTIGTTILDAIKSTVNPSTEVIFNENPDQEFIKSNHFTHAIVVIGEPPYAETRGDSQTLTMKEPGPTVISNVCEVMKCVVVVISGRPIVIEPYIASIDALVAAWLPGTEGKGVTDVLFGDYEFTGKLSRTWFRNVSQLPMNVGDLNYDPLFPFGFGMTINQIRASETTTGVRYE